MFWKNIIQIVIRGENMQLDDKKIGEIMENAGKYNGMSVLTYKNKELIAYYEHQEFAKDFVEKYLDEVFKTELPINIIYLKDGLYLSVMNMCGYVSVGGPLSELPLDGKVINRIAQEVGNDRVIENIPRIPVSSVIIMMCISYHQITGVKLSETEIFENGRIYIDKPDDKTKWKSFYELDNNMIMHELLYQNERKMLQIIKIGNEEDVENLVTDFIGQLSPNAPYNLRQYKNVFITATTIISRASVEFGVSPGEAFALSDYFTEKCENANEPSTIASILTSMMKNYMLLVRNVREHAGSSEFAVKVNGYIREHISEKISVEQMAYDFGMSRNSLSGKFKKETGYILSEYILKKKIERAKYLLSMTDYSFADISAYLGFSSQSHFQRTFKKYADVTPGEFKETVLMYK